MYLPRFIPLSTSNLQKSMKPLIRYHMQSHCNIFLFDSGNPGLGLSWFTLHSGSDLMSTKCHRTQSLQASIAEVRRLTCLTVVWVTDIAREEWDIIPRARRAWGWYHGLQVQYLAYSTRYLWQFCITLSLIAHCLFCSWSFSWLSVLIVQLRMTLNWSVQKCQLHVLLQKCKLQPWKYHPRYSHLDIKERSVEYGLDPHHVVGQIWWERQHYQGTNVLRDSVTFQWMTLWLGISPVSIIAAECGSCPGWAFSVTVIAGRTNVFRTKWKDMGGVGNRKEGMVPSMYPRAATFCVDSPFYSPLPSSLHEAVHRRQILLQPVGSFCQLTQVLSGDRRCPKGRQGVTLLWTWSTCAWINCCTSRM